MKTYKIHIVKYPDRFDVYSFPKIIDVLEIKEHSLRMAIDKARHNYIHHAAFVLNLGFSLNIPRNIHFIPEYPEVTELQTVDS